MATKADLNKVAEAAADKAVEKAFALLGVDSTKPDDMYKLRKALDFLRAWHEGTAKMGLKALLTIVSVVVAGLFGLVWVGIRTVLGHS